MDENKIRFNLGILKHFINNSLGLDYESNKITGFELWALSLMLHHAIPILKQLRQSRYALSSDKRVPNKHDYSCVSKLYKKIIGKIKVE